MTENPVKSVVEYLGEQGGLVGQVIGKEAAKALSSLIGSALKVPDAFFSGLAQGIKDDADARSRIRMAVADRLAEGAAVDDAFADRMAARWLGDEAKKQLNRENVAQATYDDLKSDPPTADVPVDEDFLARFNTFAGQASSDDMQKLFGRILAGELRKPGSFSLAALHSLSLLDQRTAEKVQRAANWVIADFIPLVGPLASGAPLEVLGVLEDLGLIRTGAITKTATVNSGKVALTTLMKEGALGWVIETQAPTLVIQVAQVTDAGKQVFSLIAPDWPEAEIQMVASALIKVSGVKAVGVGRLKRSGTDGYQIGTIRPILPAPHYGLHGTQHPQA